MRESGQFLTEQKRTLRRSFGAMIQIGCRTLVVGSLFCACLPQQETLQQTQAEPNEQREETERVEAHVFSTSTADFSEIRKAGRLRVGVPYSRTNFFLEEDRFRGFEYELFHEFEKQMHQSRARGEAPLTIIFHLTPVANLVQAVAEGKVDVAAGIVITEERQRSVAFTQPYLDDIHAVVVSNKSEPEISRLQELSGKSIVVNRGSSYPGLLEELGKSLQKEDLDPPRVELVETMETEDIFEMVNSGAISWTIAHEHLADLWKQVLPNLRVYSDLQVGQPAEFAWAVRKENPELLKVLNDYISRNRKGTAVGNTLLKRYYGSTRWISNPIEALDHDRVRPYVDLFKKYAEKHVISWIGLAAVALQESRFDPNLTSRAGAVGLMQIRPETAAEVGITGIEDPEKNIEAAARYFDLLAEKYFNDPGMDQNERAAFVLAAYNAGPVRIQRLRDEAPSHNVDPDRWFGQMETLVLRKVGREPVRYVSNIAKYYLYLNRMLLTAEERAAESLDLQ